METLSIGEVALRAGIATSTIRYYERIGLLPRAPRVNGRRRYSPDIFRTLTLVHLGQAAGFTLAELRALGEGNGGDEWRSVARRKLEEVRGRIAQLEAMQRLLVEGLACDCLDLAGCSKLGGAVQRAGLAPA